MRNIFKWVGFITIVAVIGFSMFGCEEFLGSAIGGGGTGGSVSNINIRNNTGYTIMYSWIKPSTSTSWGWDIGPMWYDGDTRPINFSQALPSNVKYDIRLRTSLSGGYIFTKYGVNISNGATITFNINDLDNGSTLPTITIQNRAGVSFNSVHLKPSSVNDWNTSIGSVSNNSNLSFTIPIPSSNHTIFDIQMRSSNPTNTYTRNNVTISDGMNFMFTSADRDNPTIELPVIVIQNNTGYTIYYGYLKPSTSPTWGSDFMPSTLSDGQSRTVTLPQSLSANSVYDIRLRTSFSGGHVFTKNNVTVTEGMILTFTTSDLEP